MDQKGRVCKLRMLKDRWNFNSMKVCPTSRSNGIILKNSMKLACVKMKITNHEQAECRHSSSMKER
ncbi:hypothetical protein E2C01_030334 [Portunus trituberculatus]|uniref:Uncharacterized protein n=1 Tax=Portunus trituberculatus TaxID=210409 RepID=A0A5B7EUH4_PORTR|nr:hypothetical protein [Portunus trituberculatus]